MSRKTFHTLLGALLLAGYAWIAWNGTVLASHVQAPATCMFKAVTHIPCPSCGATRAILLLLRGDIGGSLALNPLGAFLFAALVVLPVWLLADTIMKGKSLIRCYVGAEHILRRKAWVSVPLIVLVAANWFWNILKGL
jgi:hypothetical protein